MTKKIPISKLREAFKTIDMECRGSDEGYAEMILEEYAEAINESGSEMLEKGDIIYLADSWDDIVRRCTVSGLHGSLYNSDKKWVKVKEFGVSFSPEICFKSKADAMRYLRQAKDMHKEYYKTESKDEFIETIAWMMSGFFDGEAVEKKAALELLSERLKWEEDMGV